MGVHRHETRGNNKLEGVVRHKVLANTEGLSRKKNFNVLEVSEGALQVALVSKAMSLGRCPIFLGTRYVRNSNQWVRRRIQIQSIPSI